MAIASLIDIGGIPRKSERVEKWQFVDNALKDLQKESAKTIRDAVFTLLELVIELQGDSMGILEKVLYPLKAMRAYLDAHPEALNSSVAQALPKYFWIAERFRSVPVVWHLAYLDRWLHDRSLIPEKLYHTLPWLGHNMKSNFLDFCMKDEERREYPKLFDHHYLFHLILDNMHLLRNWRNIQKKDVTIGREYAIALMSFAGHLNPEGDTLVRILEMIDEYRHHLLPLDNRFVLDKYVKKFTDQFIHQYSLIDVHKKRFHEIHSALDNLLTSPSAKRAAYLLLVDKKLESKSYRSLLEIIDLMKQRFYIDKYSSDPRDALYILSKISSSNYAEMLTRCLNAKRKSLNSAPEVFLRTFFDWLSEISPSIDSEVKNKLFVKTCSTFAGIRSDLYELLKEEGTKLNIKHFPSYHNYKGQILLHYHLSDSLLNLLGHEDLTRLEEKQFSALKTRISYELQRILENEPETDYYIPVLYHPYYGFCLFYQRSEYPFKKVIVTFDGELFDAIPLYIQYTPMGTIELIYEEKVHSLAELHNELKEKLADYYQNTPLSDAEFLLMPIKFPLSRLHVLVDRSSIQKLYGVGHPKSELSKRYILLTI